MSETFHDNNADAKASIGSGDFVPESIHSDIHASYNPIPNAVAMLGVRQAIQPSSFPDGGPNRRYARIPTQIVHVSH
jgi:hypothetical protein